MALRCQKVAQINWKYPFGNKNQSRWPILDWTWWNNVRKQQGASGQTMFGLFFQVYIVTAMARGLQKWQKEEKLGPNMTWLRKKEKNLSFEIWTIPSLTRSLQATWIKQKWSWRGTDRQTNIATCRLNRPRRWLRWSSRAKKCKKNRTYIQSLNMVFNRGYHF